MCEIVASILLMAVPYDHAQVQVQTTGTPGSPSAMCALRIGTVKNSKNFLRVDGPARVMMVVELRKNLAKQRQVSRCPLLVECQASVSRGDSTDKGQRVLPFIGGMRSLIGGRSVTPFC